MCSSAKDEERSLERFLQKTSSPSPVPLSPGPPSLALGLSLNAHYIARNTAIASRAISSSALPAWHRPAASHIYVCTHMKSGTTLAQALLYRLTAAAGLVDGDATGDAFALDISCVAPFLDIADASGIRAPALPTRRPVWKTHALPDVLPPDACTVIVVRDGLRAAASYLDFTLPLVYPDVVQALEADDKRVRGASGETGKNGRTPTARDFFVAAHCFDIMLKPGAPWRAHMARSLARVARERAAPDAKPATLLACYERVVHDLPRFAQRLCAHADIPASAAAQRAAVAQHHGGRPALPRRHRRALLLPELSAVEADRLAKFRVRSADAPGYGASLKDGPLFLALRREYEAMLRRQFGVDSYEQLCDTF